MRQRLAATLVGTFASAKPGKAVAERNDGEYSTSFGNYIRSKQRIVQSQVGGMAAEELAKHLAAVQLSASGNQHLERITAGTFKGKGTKLRGFLRLGNHPRV